MFKNNFKNKPWYSYTIAICAGVLLFVVLTHISDIMGGARTFIGYFTPVLLGCIIAYLINPLAKFYEVKIFKGIKNEKIRMIVADTLAILTVLLVLVYAMIMLVPELISSVKTFVGNIDLYIDSLDAFLKSVGLSSADLGLQGWTGSSEKVLRRVSEYLSGNIDEVVATSANAGRIVIQWGIAFLLSIYLLANKGSIKYGIKRLLKAALKEEKYQGTRAYLSRCNQILNRYVVFNILDALIVGVVNMIFMVIMGFPYAWLISFVVALTNLVPTFGPFVGGGIGAFILLLVKPWYALAFMAFTLVLQLIDGYVLKPKIFGGSLGVPALWILIGIVVSGKMFGVIGILLSIPIVAIINFTYDDYFMPWLERRKKEDG
ncbi:MAG: AI-2E family transporter [Firmicutes bacterium]|nr:AI-2E family transporter [Bacillota bacterium]